VTDAEKLMAGFIPAVSASVFAIAPERARELNDVIFKRAPWILDFTVGSDRRTFIAYPRKQILEARFFALLSLWASANAALLFAREMMEAARAGRGAVSTAPGSAAANAINFVAAAKELLRDPSANWPAELPLPDPHPQLETHQWYVNQLFLASTAWVLLHEVAHVHLGHEETTIAEILIQQEREADDWATRWILEHAPEDLRREFRSVACATGLAWVGLGDEIQRGLTTHPHASQRLTASSRFFPLAEESPALEMAGHIVKAFFNPSEPVPDSEHPGEAFDRILHWYRDAAR
jgi:Peptidase U49